MEGDGKRKKRLKDKKGERREKEGEGREKEKMSSRLVYKTLGFIWLYLFSCHGNLVSGLEGGRRGCLHYCLPGPFSPNPCPLDYRFPWICSEFPPINLPKGKTFVMPPNEHFSLAWPALNMLRNTLTSAYKVG